MKQMVRRLKANPRLLLLLFLLVMYTDLFILSIGLFVIYPDDHRPTVEALIPPLVFLPVIGLILFKQLPALKDRSRRLYRVALVLPSISLIAFLAYGDWIISRLGPDNFSGLLTKWDAVYFTFTTMATVGYGDIYPRSQLARLWVVCQIVVGFAFVAYVIQREVVAGSGKKRDKK
jgi:hypothetical protein